VLNKEDTGLEFAIAANEHGRHSPKPDGVGSDEIFRIGGEVVLLTAVQAKLANLLQELAQLWLAQDEVGGACAAIAQRASASPIEGKTIGHGLVDTE
jgi:hypothetical protein